VRRGSVVRSQLVLLVSYAARSLCVLGATVVVARHTSAAEFGFFALVAVLFTLVHIVLDFGAGPVAAREAGRAPDQERRLIELVMGMRRIIGVVVAAAFVVGALSQDDPVRRGVLLASAVVTAMLSPGGWFPAFQVRQAQEGPALAGAAAQSLVLLGALALAAADAPGALYAALVPLRELTWLLLMDVMGRRVTGYRPRPGIRGRGLRPFLAMSVWQGLATCAYAASFHVDTFLVLGLLDEAAVGRYAAGFRLVNPLLMLPGLLTMPLIPVLSAAAGADRAAFSRLLAASAGVLGGLGALAAVGGVLLAPDLVTLLYEDHFGADSVAALRWLSVALGAAFLTSSFTSGLIGDRKERWLLVLAATGLVVNVVSNLLLIPVYGVPAAAWTTAATEGVVLAMAVGVVARATTGPLLTRSQLRPFLPAAAMAALLLMMDGVAPLGRVAAGLAAGLLGLCVVLLDPSARELRRPAGEGHPNA
jgi:O-antigen/teichoic acid export membrane protein